MKVFYQIFPIVDSVILLSIAYHTKLRIAKAKVENII